MGFRYTAYGSLKMDLSEITLKDEHLEVVKVVMNESKKIADRIRADVYIDFGNISDYSNRWTWGFDLSIDVELKFFHGGDHYAFSWPEMLREAPPPKKPVFFEAVVDYRQGNYIVPDLFLCGISLGEHWSIPKQIWEVLGKRFARKELTLQDKELWEKALAYAAALIDIIHQKNLKRFSWIDELIALKRETIIKGILEDLGLEEKLWYKSLD